ncbi:hypothetical protein [Miniimonas arenae]|nr:hypothetical protein [Miniimonas arenae]
MSTLRDLTAVPHHDGSTFDTVDPLLGGLPASARPRDLSRIANGAP